MSRTDRWLVTAGAVLVTAALASGVVHTDFWPPDEARVGEISREMLVSGRWRVPRLNGKPFLEEPPLFYWSQVLAFRAAGGPSTVAARLPGAIAAIGGVLCTALLASVLGAPASFAAIILATAPEYWWMARVGTQDAATAAATACCLGAFFVAWRTGRRSLLAVAVISAGVSFWLKGLLGPGLASVSILLFVGTAGRGRLRPSDLVAAAAALAALASLWIVLLWRSLGADAVYFFLVTNHLGRLAGASDTGHVRPTWYYLPNLALGLFPWSLTLPSALWGAWRARADRARWFSLIWATSMTLVLTLSASKRPQYLLPAYPAFALLIAQWWAHAVGQRSAPLTCWLVAGALVIICPLLALILSGLPTELVMAVAETTGHVTTAVAEVWRALAPPWWSWGAAILVCNAGLWFAAALRAGNPRQTMAGAAICLLVVHLVIELVTLPSFNPLASARPLGRRLAQIAERDVRLLAFGFPNREALSPFLFYAGRKIPELSSPERLEWLLRSRPSCALVHARAYATLAPSVPDLAHTDERIGGLSLVLLSGTTGGCE